MAAANFAGVLVPVLTPFTPEGEPDAARFAAFCRWLLDEGADGLAVFGTTSEANSMSPQERMALLDHLIAAGIPAAKLMPGTGACAISDALALTRHALAHGCAGVLMLPPFYYKGMPDEGLYAFIAGVIDRIASPALKIYLYHIPPVAQVGWSLELVGRLIRAYPDTVVGLKDSSGDWQNTAALLERYPGFAVPVGGLKGRSGDWQNSGALARPLPRFAGFPGSGVFLLAGLRKGAAGC